MVANTNIIQLEACLSLMVSAMDLFSPRSRLSTKLFVTPILQPSLFCEVLMTKQLIVVAGNIGVGKTSLTERIGARLGWRTGYESVADNPYLADFYGDMRAWSFHLQIFFLGHRAEQYLDAARDARSAILDRSIYEDFHIFARALHHMGDLSERDYLAYRRLFELTVNSIPRPNLLIYLKAPVHVLMDRIRRRARNMETGITPEYLTLLDSFYDEWLDPFDLCPVLTISTDDLDFVHQQKHLDTVVNRIQDKLAGKELVEF
jgi:deoxyadenosine/deoxycytidine kinase